jgi:hypothetical protein
MPRTCAHCHADLPPGGRLYCSSRCKMRATRRRRAGLPEDAFPEGFRGGSFRAVQQRKLEQAAYVEVVLASRLRL